MPIDIGASELSFSQVVEHFLIGLDLDVAYWGLANVLNMKG